MAKQSTKALALLLTVFLLLSAVISLPLSANAREEAALPAGRLLSLPRTSRTTAALPSTKTKVGEQIDLTGMSLYVGGMPFGVKFLTDGVIVVGFHPIQGTRATESPAHAAGIREGDVILKVNGASVMSADDLARTVEESGGKPLELLYSRNGSSHRVKITPIYSPSEERYSTGIYVRDSGAGIGTVTFIDPKTFAFAGLGHGICDGETGELIPMQRGSVVDVTIHGVVKGLSGAPGEVRGTFRSGKIGSLLGNTHCGVYGVLTALPETCPCKTPLPVGSRNEITAGKATIYCTLEGNTPQRYEVEICEIQRASTSNKCFTVKVTDPALLAKSGGIVQGMSGSPIIQNGKLVGAVTHVLINDPTTGYGIFIENMLSATQVPMQKAA